MEVKKEIQIKDEPLYLKDEPLYLEDETLYLKDEPLFSNEEFAENGELSEFISGVDNIQFNRPCRRRIRFRTNDGIDDNHKADIIYENLPENPDSGDEDETEDHVEGETCNVECKVENEIDDPIDIPTEEPTISSTSTRLESSDFINNNSTQDSATAEGTRWRKIEQNQVAPSFVGTPFSKVSNICSPYQYFKTFFDDHLFEHIAKESNLYCMQEKTTKNIRCKLLETDKNEIEQFVGILLFMGVYSLPQYRMYWSSIAPLPQITGALKGGVSRFENLKRFLHFNDNLKMPDSNSPNYDELYKVRPIVNSVLEKCKNLEAEEYNSVDEQIIPTKSRSQIKQYFTKKPHKLGYKVFTRCGVSGIIYNFEICTGKSENPHQASSLGGAGDLVMRLCENLPKHKNYKVCFDNYFTSLPLLKKLREDGILALGTIRPNQMMGAQKLLLSDKELKVKGRGSFDWRKDSSSNVTVVKWHDNNCIQLASTYISHVKGTKVRRWSAKDKDYVEIECPQIVHEYNKFMGGVDLCDMFLSLYRINLRSTKWYVPIFFYLIKISLTNGWLLYRRHYEMLNGPNDKKYMSLLQFQISIANDLTLAGKASGLSPRDQPSTSSEPSCKKSRTSASVPIPQSDFRFDLLDHFPIYDDKIHRCRKCKKGYTFIKCSKCKIFLCLVKQRNCFLVFHKK